MEERKGTREKERDRGRRGQGRGEKGQGGWGGSRSASHADISNAGPDSSCLRYKMFSGSPGGEPSVGGEGATGSPGCLLEENMRKGATKDF